MRWLFEPVAPELGKKNQTKRRDMLDTMDSSADDFIARVVRSASQGFYDDRCSGLTDAQIGAAYRAVRARGIAVEHALDVCALLRPGDDPRALTDALLLIKPHMRES
jgi:hypothetical protein